MGDNTNTLPTKPFSKDGPKVTMVGLGGEGVLRTHKMDFKAREVIQAAIQQGITYFDSARVYSDSEVYYGSVWRELPDTRATVFRVQYSCLVSFVQRENRYDTNTDESAGGFRNYLSCRQGFSRGACGEFRNGCGRGDSIQSVELFSRMVLQVSYLSFDFSDPRVIQIRDQCHFSLDDR